MRRKRTNYLKSIDLNVVLLASHLRSIKQLFISYLQFNYYFFIFINILFHYVVYFILFILLCRLFYFFYFILSSIYNSIIIFSYYYYFFIFINILFFPPLKDISHWKEEILINATTRAPRAKEF